MARRYRKQPNEHLIILTGTRLYLEKGFTATSNSMLCHELDISSSQLYSCFPTKEHLLVELIKRLCEFQWKVIEQMAAEGESSMLAYCLELAAIAAICHRSAIEKDLYIAAYTHPMSLEIIRQNDCAKAQKIFGEYRPGWTAHDFRLTENLVSGIEFGTLMTVGGEDVCLDDTVCAAIRAVLMLYGVPDELAEQKINRILALDYQRIGESLLNDFSAYLDKVNRDALEEALHAAGH